MAVNLKAPLSLNLGWCTQRTKQLSPVLSFGASLLALVITLPLSAGQSSPWKAEELFQTPKVYPTEQCRVEGFKGFFYEGLEYKAQPTKVFAYYKAPDGTPPAGGWPAVVLAHGGGGTAFTEWVKVWVQHGYAAIAMDLEGHLPQGKAPDRPWHEQAGPARITTFGDIELAEHEQWFYHAVGDVVRAHQLLRSFPEINPAKIGVTGISWGGVIVSATVGVDTNWAFAIPVYGCGFLHEEDTAFQQYFQVMSPAHLQSYRTRWDPSVYLPRSTTPMLWIVGSNDKAFALNVWQKSAKAAGGPTTMLAPLRMSHGHKQGREREEIYAFADSVVKGTTPLPKVGSVTRQGGRCTVPITSTAKIAHADLCFTRDGGSWENRKWDSTSATLTPEGARAEVPAGTKVFYFNLTDERGLMVSSEHLEIE